MDKISQEQRRKNMQAIKSKGMKPEMIVRRLIHAMGYRYRLHKKDLPGKPDLVFSSRKKVIFVHGCFWHQHSVSSCRITHVPKSNLDFWIPKLERTKERDKVNLRELRRLGWKHLIIWECALKNPQIAQRKVARFLE